MVANSPPPLQRFFFRYGTTVMCIALLFSALYASLPSSINFPMSWASSIAYTGKHSYHQREDIVSVGTSDRQLQQTGSSGNGDEKNSESPLSEQLYAHHSSSYSRLHGPASISSSSRSDIHASHNKQHHIAQHEHHHKKAWMVLEEVDGLRNEDVVMVLSSTTIKGYLQSRIIPAARTWMRYFANVLIIVEDTFSARFGMRHCHQRDFDQFTTFSCHNEPTYVLSRSCDNRYYGAAGPCCKVDAALHFVTNVHTELFAHTKYLLHCDDDVYWRPDQVLRWLAAVDRSGIHNFPIIANPQANTMEQSKGIWHVKECKEIRPSGWYQPLMLNRAALEKMRVASASYGLTDTCAQFQVTHDVGVGAYAWLFGLYHIQMPSVDLNGRHQGLPAAKGHQMALHFVKHKGTDNCQDGAHWPDEYRYNQSISIGCGDIGVPAPNHDAIDGLADMYDLWEYYKVYGKNVVVGVDGQTDWRRHGVILDTYIDSASGESVEYVKVILMATKRGKMNNPLEQLVAGENYTTIEWEEYTYREGDRYEIRLMPTLELLRNYKETKHGQANDLTKKWVKFGPADCDPPGSFK